MSNPIRLDVVPYGVKRHIAKVLDRTFRDMTIKPVHGYSEQNANINREVIVYERYKITILSESDNTDPNFAPWAVLETRSSGLGQLSDFTPIIAPNSFVEVEENENGEYSVSEPIGPTIEDLIDLFVSASLVSGWSIESIEQAIIEKSYELQDKEEE